jgi:biopolymer transport protein ExbD
MKKSFLNQSKRRSPILEAQKMNGKAKKALPHQSLAIALPLTSLIDAFSIIVIYLLIGTQSGAIEVPTSKSITLPVAQNSESLNTSVATLRIEKSQLFLNDRPVTFENLGQKLDDLKKSVPENKMELLVQADQNMDYAALDPVIKAGSLAGIEKLKFAVLPTR